MRLGVVLLLLTGGLVLSCDLGPWYVDLLALAVWAWAVDFAARWADRRDRPRRRRWGS